MSQTGNIEVNEPDSRVVVLNGIYKHYKGNYYRVLNVSRDSGNPQLRKVIYQALYYSDEFGDKCIWDRPIKEFLSLTDKGVPIFEHICSL